uniref:Uncharacterized protein n=1 Tax=Arundo donax TaxID=35708 RepID=A0A0A8ZZ02_ARUDO
MMTILALTTPKRRPDDGFFLPAPLRRAPQSWRILVKSLSFVEEFTVLPRELGIEGFGRIGERGKGVGWEAPSDGSSLVENPGLY